MKKIRLSILVAIAAAFTACEDVVDLDIQKGTSFPVLDAWITTEPGIQKIRFTKSLPYTDQTPAPVIGDAVITLFDETARKSYPFIFKDGTYTYDPGDNQTIGVVGHAYRLRVEYNTEVFEAIDTIKRITPIDSISYEWQTKDENFVSEDGYVAKFHAKDIAGGVDYYWMRSYRNDLQHKVGDAFSVDGYFDQSVKDGSAFILPIQEAVTDFDKPFQKGEKVVVKLRSVTYQSHFFLTQVQAQINAGGLFAKVLENVKCNALNVTPGGGQSKILGWFGVSAVSSMERVIE
ncbi:DUF4249 domain-containing protein [Chitinophaga rhizophila]|uniref:DUF4249 domain-containing protein n=1 Tax=Chitinophaga rhizophila TaxID=2866212 RepID=A0ABS7GCF2_9BACT|nr:DUF4249 domain-containing protein [Chitinophaga rhizophila]MBW8684830.1 DUF4249 domain-containing protein [Chitinophaga rhizophila]